MSTSAGISQTGATTSSISISYSGSTTTPPLSSWSVSGPSGVIASAGETPSGSFAGTATITGLSADTSYSFSVFASSVSGTANNSYSFNTDSEPLPTYPPVWTDNTLAGFVAGSAYSDSVSATNSPTYSVSVGSLPTGISRSGGTLSGTPTVSGQSYSFTLRAANVDGEVTAAFSGTVGAPATPAPVWSDNTLGGFQVGVAYSDGVSATNSPTYSVISGALPSGISLNGSTGAVTGTPTVSGQSYSFTLRALNAGGNVVQAFSGAVAAASTAGRWRVWTGSVWVVAPLKVWNGSVWTDSSVKVWNGSAWVTSV